MSGGRLRQPGGASASVRDVAALAEVSVGTVSNVLNRPEKVTPAIVSRVQAAIDELGFVRNDAARQLRAGLSRSIGLVVLDVGNPFFADVIAGAEDRAADAGLTIIVGNSGNSQLRESTHLDLFEEQRVRGVLVSPFGDVLSRLALMRRRGIRAVLVDRQAEDRSVPSVDVDDVAGGYLAVSHLASIGRSRVAIILGPNTKPVLDRLEGARKAADENGIALELIRASAMTVLQGRDIGEAITRRPPAKRPEAVFAANDLLAVGVMHAFTMAGSIRIPDDIALIGYDDIDFAAAAVVPLSSIRQPSALLGYTAVDLLLQLGETTDATAQQVVFQPELVVRASTVPG